MSMLKTLELMMANEIACRNSEYARMRRNRPEKKHPVFEICGVGYSVIPYG